jgi:hypothetical protein
LAFSQIGGYLSF